MTKLMEWLAGLALFLALWLAALNGYSPINIPHIILLTLPVLLLAIFGFASIAIIAYRVATFNDCPEAAKELKLEIETAKKELKAKGINIS